LAALALTVPAAVTALAGLNVESQAAILRRVDEVGTRFITVVSSGSSRGIPGTAVRHFAALEGVDWVIGLGPVQDVRVRAPVGQATPARGVVSVRAPVNYSSEPTIDTAYVSTSSATRLGLSAAVGVIDPGGLDVLGWFNAAEPLESLETFVLVPVSAGEARLERVLLLVDDAARVDAVIAAIPNLVGRDARPDIRIEASKQLVEARAAVRDELVARDRIVIVALLIVGTLVSSLVVFAGTMTARRDFGRRRALGATRGQLTALVIMATAWPAIGGATLGALLGWAYLVSVMGYLVPPNFPAAVAVLTVVSFAGAAGIPASYAATRDPLTVLRVP
jgi:putative ABC transport system permease protein